MHYFAERTAVVIGHPSPQLELRARDDRLVVDSGDDGFGAVSLRRLMMYVDHQCGIELIAASELHLYPDAELYVGKQCFRNVVGEWLGHRQRQNDSSVGLGGGDGM